MRFLEVRPLYVRLLEDEQFLALSPEGQRLFFFLRLSKECGPVGLFRLDINSVATRMYGGVTDAAVNSLNEAIGELIAHGWIEMEQGWVWIRNAMRFEPTFNPNTTASHKRWLDKQLKQLGDLGLARRFIEHYKLDEPKGWDKEDRNQVEWQWIIDYWNEVMPHCKMRGIAGKRREHISARWKELGKAGIKELIDKTASSSFLTGKSGKWKCDADWPWWPGNAVKILEGKYDDDARKLRNPADTWQREYEPVNGFEAVAELIRAAGIQQQNKGNHVAYTRLTAHADLISAAPSWEEAVRIEGFLFDSLWDVTDEGTQLMIEADCSRQARAASRGSEERVWKAVRDQHLRKVYGLQNAHV